MATKVVNNDGAIVVSFTATDDQANTASQVRMGPVLGGKAVAQIAVSGEVVNGSNDGTNWVAVATAGSNNAIVTIDPLPLLISVPSGNTGAAIVVGWQDR